MTEANTSNDNILTVFCFHLNDPENKFFMENFDMKKRLLRYSLDYTDFFLACQLLNFEESFLNDNPPKRSIGDELEIYTLNVKYSSCILRSYFSYFFNWNSLYTGDFFCNKRNK